MHFYFYKKQTCKYKSRFYCKQKITVRFKLKDSGKASKAKQENL